MALSTYLIHTCTIQRSTPTPDAYNNDVDSWADVETLTGACRLIVRRQDVEDTKTAQEPIVAHYQMMVLPAADVQEGDRLINVTYPDSTVLSQVFSIEAVMPRWNGSSEDHTVLDLKRIS